METKTLIIVILAICFSCSRKFSERKNYQLNGKVMMANILYPLKTKIVVYQDKKKLAETNSNKEGLFEINIPRCNLKKNLTFIVTHKAKPDTIYNTNGYEKILYSCEKNDTIIKKISKQENKIDLLVQNCYLLIVPDEPINEGY